MPKIAGDIRQRILHRTTELPNGCWEWQGYRMRPRNGDGAGTYGVIGVGSRRDGTKGSALVHRAMWEYLHGPIPDGMMLCHTCDNPACVNPDHLFLGTQTDNMRDNIAKGRKPLKVSRLMADVIRAQYATGGITYIGLSELHNLSPSTIRRILQHERVTDALT